VRSGISSVPQITGHIGDWVLGMHRGVITYQPAGRFWPFHFIEGGIFVALTAAALGAAIWLLHRRAAWTALSPAHCPAAGRRRDLRRRRSAIVAVAHHGAAGRRL
jgi:hypothetical protein